MTINDSTCFTCQNGTLHPLAHKTSCVSCGYEFADIQAENERLRNALGEVTPWLQAALSCKAWVWDGEQEYYADRALNIAEKLLKGGTEC